MIMIIVMMITLLLLLLAMLAALPALAVLVLSLLLFGYLLWRYNDLSRQSKTKQVCPVKRAA